MQKGNIANFSEQSSGVSKIYPSFSGKPVIVVGAGPVGIHVAQKLLKQKPEYPVMVFGNEPWKPYNRLRISSVLSGDITIETLDNSLHVPENSQVIQHTNCAIKIIDRKAKTLTDANNITQSYSKLILATGSSTYIPKIIGTHLSGVYPYRNLNDIRNLQSRRNKSRHCLIIGGGLLGLEAACAMQNELTNVVVVQSSNRLLSNLIDDEASNIIKTHLENFGIKIVLGDGIQSLLGKQKLVGARLKSGKLLSCDTAILATGISPNVSLARKAGLKINRGVVVDDMMKTSDDHIYAIGECAEHQGKVYGWLKPGYEQASVAAQTVFGLNSKYHGTVPAVRLKIADLPVYSLGQVNKSNVTKQA